MAAKPSRTMLERRHFLAGRASAWRRTAGPFLQPSFQKYGKVAPLEPLRIAFTCSALRRGQTRMVGSTVRARPMVHGVGHVD
jgi:hypothetical protein